MQLSIIIPLYNEEESLEELNEAIEKVVSNMDIDYEVIYIDDGSTDNSWNIITNLSETSFNLKGIKFLRNFLYPCIRMMYSCYIISWIP